MTGFIAILADIVGTLAGALAIWLGVRVLRDDKKNDSKSKKDDRLGSDTSRDDCDSQ